MRICLIEAYDTGSHRYFYQGLKSTLEEEYNYTVDVMTLPGRHWRSRLQKSHMTLARETSFFYEKEASHPDAFIVTSLTDGAAFRGLLAPSLRSVPIIHYMHENQMSYPINPSNLSHKNQELFQQHILPAYHLNQAMAADKLVFNSHFHLEDFFCHLDSFLKEHSEKSLREKCLLMKEEALVIPIGLPWPKDPLTPFHDRPKRLLWNHRWEYDKGPQEFSTLIERVLKQHPQWQVSLIGEIRVEVPEAFTSLQKNFPENVVQFGRLEKRQDYLNHLQLCRVLPVTSHHDFLGLAVLEAMLYGVIPILPKRLIYPELIPQELHDTLLYKDEGVEFYEKVHRVMDDGLSKEQENLLRESLALYKWNKIALQWQKLLEEVC